MQMKKADLFADNITDSERYATKWILHELLVCGKREITFTVKEAAKYAMVHESAIRIAIKMLATVNCIKWNRCDKGIEVKISSYQMFYSLLEKLEVG